MVTNVQDIAVTGKKSSQKIYYSHSGYVKGLKSVRFSDLFSRNPALVLRKAVYGMLPRNSNRIERMKRLFIFCGPSHPFERQLYKQYMPKFDGDQNIIELEGNVYQEDAAVRPNFRFKKPHLQQ